MSLGFQEPSQDFFGALGGWSVSTMGIQFGKGTLESCWDALERLVRRGVRRFRFPQLLSSGAGHADSVTKANLVSG